MKIRTLSLLLILLAFHGCSAEKDDAYIMTVNGPIDASEAGICLTHEHILVDFSGADIITTASWDRREVMKRAFPFLEVIRKVGCKTFFECTPAYLGRDPLLLKMLSDTLGINIVTNTGYYGAGGNKFLPANAFNESAEELAARWISEWENGIDGTGIKPGFLKTAVADGNLSDLHRKLIRAAAITHLKTGLTIVSHTGRAVPAFDQLGVLNTEGVSPEAFVWVHAQNEKNLNAHVLAAKLGAWVSFDGLNDRNVNTYAEMICNMKGNGLMEKVLVSHDAGWYHPGEENGGDYRGYITVFQKLIPELKKRGLTAKDIRQILVINPARAFSVRIRRLE